MKKEKPSEFERATEGENASLLAEFFAMLRENKKFWLLPIVVALLLVGVIVVLSSTAAAPFVYSLF